MICASAQTGKHATARIFESQTKKLSHIILVYDTGESEIIPLQLWQPQRSMASKAENLIDNQKTINKLLNDMAEKGYEITEMTSSGETTLYTFIVFTRKEEKKQ